MNPRFHIFHFIVIQDKELIISTYCIPIIASKLKNDIQTADKNLQLEDICDLND